MELVKLNNQFDPDPYLTVPIQEDWVKSFSFKNFDKDGYEVPSLVESLHYLQVGLPLHNALCGHKAYAKTWYEDKANSEFGLVLDHSMLLHRKGFAGEARERILEVAQQRPILYKLLTITPKWGIDFSLDYVDHDICMEVIHIEQDFFNLEEAIAAKEKLEHIINTTDWEQGVKDLLARKAEWKDLSSDDHSDYKAQLFGWHRAFDNKKVFST